MSPPSSSRSRQQNTNHDGVANECNSDCDHRREIGFRHTRNQGKPQMHANELKQKKHRREICVHLRPSVVESPVTNGGVWIDDD